MAKNLYDQVVSDQVDRMIFNKSYLDQQNIDLNKSKRDWEKFARELANELNQPTEELGSE